MSSAGGQGHLLTKTSAEKLTFPFALQSQGCHISQNLGPE